MEEFGVHVSISNSQALRFEMPFLLLHPQGLLILMKKKNLQFADLQRPIRIPTFFESPPNA
jgi:hypothetical protein